MLVSPLYDDKEQGIVCIIHVLHGNTCHIQKASVNMHAYHFKNQQHIRKDYGCPNPKESEMAMSSLSLNSSYVRSASDLGNVMLISHVDARRRHLSFVKQTEGVVGSPAPGSLLDPDTNCRISPSETSPVPSAKDITCNKNGMYNTTTQPYAPQTRSDMHGYI